jgi:hypothetical protein
MWNDENNDAGPQVVKETLTSYEEAAKEFAVSAADFLQHLALLTKARDAYHLALAISAHLRDTLDSGDETLRNLKAKLEDAVADHLGSGALDGKKPAAMKRVETVKAIGEKTEAARA